MPSNRSNLIWYSVVVFLSSVFLMTLEITAGRLIAPYVGVSLYTWTSVIGVILAGLSLGNWIGGVWADRGGKEGAAGVTLMLASLTSLAVLLILTLVAPLIEQHAQTLLSASFLYMASLFFLPAVMLGVITPLLTTLALRLDSRTGHIVGRMHALAALGSIVGTFITGYWLIQYFGTRTVIIASAAFLFLLAVPFIIQARTWGRAALIAMLTAGMVAITAARQGYVNPCDRETQYFCIRVVDVSRDLPPGGARAMILDHLLHSINHRTSPGLLAAPYVHVMDELVRLQLGGRASRARYFFAGGGAYTQPRAIRHLDPEASVTVAEIDPLVTQTAVNSLYVDTGGMRVIHQDARVALQRLSGERFDVIIGDVFHDIAVPYHLTTREYMQLVRQSLATGGIYLMNVVDAYPDPLLVKSLVKTLQTEFRYVDLWLEAMPQEPQRVTFVLSATDGPEPPDRLTAARGFNRSWIRVTRSILGRDTPLENVPLLTDDFVPTDRLVSRLFIRRLGR